jgi:hypothetical protein
MKQQIFCLPEYIVDIDILSLYILSISGLIVFLSHLLLPILYTLGSKEVTANPSLSYLNVAILYCSNWFDAYGARVHKTVFSPHFIKATFGRTDTKWWGNSLTKQIKGK